MRAQFYRVIEIEMRNHRASWRTQSRDALGSVPHLRRRRRSTLRLVPCVVGMSVFLVVTAATFAGAPGRGFLSGSLFELPVDGSRLVPWGIATCV